MTENELLHSILDKLVSLDEGQKELKQEILLNRQAICELKSDVEDIKQSMRFYDHKLVEHEKQIFKLQS